VGRLTFGVSDTSATAKEPYVYLFIYVYMICLRPVYAKLLLGEEVIKAAYDPNIDSGGLKLSRLVYIRPMLVR